jgi:hypothetical protein
MAEAIAVEVSEVVDFILQVGYLNGGQPDPVTMPP